MTEKKKLFEICIEYRETLSAKEIWPDGDGPENPTEDDVYEAMQNYGPWTGVILEWNFDDPDVTVTECVPPKTQ
jgi:hypothetical protein